MTAPDAEAIAPGLTEVIAEVLAGHPGYQLRMTVWHCACGHPLDITDARPDVAQRAHQSAMVANAIGERWACVELPKPSPTCSIHADHGATETVWHWGASGEYSFDQYDRSLHDQYGNVWGADELLEMAGAALAAASVAEGETP